MTSAPVCCDDVQEDTAATCGRCDAPVCGNCQVLIDGIPVCAACGEAFEQKLQEERGGMQNMLPALGLGAAAAVAAAIVWTGIVVVTNFEIGYAAIGLGWLVGMGVHRGAGRKRGQAFQIMAAALAAGGLLLAKLMIFDYFVVQAVHEEGGQISYFNPEILLLFVQNLAQVFGGYDILWVILAVATAWGVAEPTKVTIAKSGEGE